MKIIKLTSLALITMLTACAGQLSGASHVSIAEEFPATNTAEIKILLKNQQKNLRLLG